MTVALTSQAPPGLTVQGSAVALQAVYAVTPGSTSRAFTVTVDGVARASLSGGSTTVSSGFSLVLSNTSDRVVITLSKDSGWATGAHAWSISYTDSTGTATATGKFAVVDVTPAVISPAPGQTRVSRRPLIYASFDLSTGTPQGVDLRIGGSDAVVAGAVRWPAFVGATGGAGSRAYASVQSRRGFGFDATIEVEATVRLSFSTDVYTWSYAYSVSIGERPPSRTHINSGMAPLSNPMGEALRLIAAEHLRPRGASPPLGTALRRVLQRCTIGQIAPASVRRIPVELQPEDDPSATALIAFVESAAPLWGGLLSLFAPQPEQDALTDAWRSGHPIERAGALCLLALYAIEGSDGV